jgi:hypothetical protein
MDKDLKRWQWCLVYLGIVLSATVIVAAICELVRINIDKF